MWIMTKLGFFSAVQDKDNRERVMVRARDRADLENLVNWFDTSIGILPQIIDNSGTDYPCRIFVSNQHWAEFCFGAALQIDYTNFKNRIAEIPGQRDKGWFYHEVWAAMRKWQAFREGTDTTFGILASGRGDELFDLGPQGPARVARSRRNGKFGEVVKCSYCNGAAWSDETGHCPHCSGTGIEP